MEDKCLKIEVGEEDEIAQLSFMYNDDKEKLCLLSRSKDDTRLNIWKIANV